MVSDSTWKVECDLDEQRSKAFQAIPGLGNIIGRGSDSLKCTAHSEEREKNSVPADMRDVVRGSGSWEGIWGQIIFSLECNAKKLALCSIGNMVPGISFIRSGSIFCHFFLRFGLGEPGVMSGVIYDWLDLQD